MNKCHFIGRFTLDPEVEKIVNDNDRETSVVNFTLAINRRFRKNNGEIGKNVVYLDFEAWDSGAEVICKNFRAGHAIIVHASARSTPIEAYDGSNVNKVTFRVEEFSFPSEQNLVTRD